MVFASLTFLYIFLPLNLILYYSWKNKLYRNCLLTLMSLIFYAWGEPIWISLLIFSALIDYINGLLVERWRNTPLSKLPLISTLVVNLGLLATFKYASFITQNVNLILGTNFDVPSYALPIGISFYSFQTISYVVDVYKQEVRAQKSFLKFMLFVSLYHQLVAGPIVRYAHVAHEIDHRVIHKSDLSAGILRFCIGLFKKICIANVAGELVQTYLVGDLSSVSVAEAWFGILMFTLQIYFDFSGYSDMAIGLGRMVGFHYHENFNYPYISKSAGDFWRRWHISLGTFFRDYIYIPLGGNKTKVYRNLFVVWLLTGLWHGASWNFIFWGLFWGFLIFIERLFLNKLLSKLPLFVSHLYLLSAVVVGWIFFYFVELDRMGHFFKIIFGFSDNPWVSSEFKNVFQGHIYWLILSIILCFPVYHWIHSKIRRTTSILVIKTMPIFTIAFSLTLLFLSTAMLVGKTFNPFLYFRF